MKKPAIEIDAIIQGIYDKEFSEVEMIDIHNLVKKWILRNFDDNRDEVDMIKSEFYNACKESYPQFYFEKLANLDYSKGITQ